MNILSAHNLSKTFGLKTLFQDVSLGVDDRDRVAVVGVNGSGKSTLLKVLCGQIEPDTGYVNLRQGVTISVLEQVPHLPPEKSILDCIFSKTNKEGRLVGEYEEVCRRLEQHPEDESVMKRLEELTRRMETEHAWDHEFRAKTILTKLGIHDFDAPANNLSGGYKKRVALARALLAEPDILILDEPTNQLDADTIAWLEQHLSERSGAVMFVTHDRYFLDRVANRIIEIERGIVQEYPGNYGDYLERKNEESEIAAKKEQRRVVILRKELDWLKQGCKARTTKQQARIERVHDLVNAAPEKRPASLSFNVKTRRLGKSVLELKDISHSYDDCVLINDFTHIFKPGERLGVIGPNGCGKTTLANIMTGRLQPDSGTVKTGATVHFGYYDQLTQEMDPRLKAIDYVKEEGGAMLPTPEGDYMTAELVMERFLFTDQMMHTPVEKLSGGERRRLYLVRTLMRDPNFLVLDEPTNDLDLPTLQALEDFLDAFSGCLVAVSHDRYFLDRNVEMVMAFEEEGVLRRYPGGYTIYSRLREEYRQKIKSDEPEKPKKVKKREKPEGPRKLKWKEERELEALEEQIPEMECRLEQILEDMATHATDYTRLLELTKEKEALEANLEKAMDRWSELAAIAENSG